jgi:ATP-binding cassette subfamily B protein
MLRNALSGQWIALSGPEPSTATTLEDRVDKYTHFSPEKHIYIVEVKGPGFPGIPLTFTRVFFNVEWWRAVTLQRRESTCDPAIPEAEPIQPLLRLIPYLKRYRLTVVLGFLSLLLTNLIMLIAPRVLQLAIDGLRGVITRRELILYAVLFVLVVTIQGVFRYLVRQTIGVVSRRIEYDLRNDLYRHLQRLPISFYHRMRTGDIMSRATNDLSAVRYLLGPGIMYSANAVIVFFAAVSVMLFMNPALTALSLIPMIILPMFSNRLSKKLYERSRQVQEQIAEISGLAQESISGVRVVKGFAREGPLLEQFRQASLHYVNRSMDLIRIQGVIWPMMGTIAGMSSVLAIWYGGMQVIDGALTLGELVAFDAYLGFLMWPMMALGWVINIIQRGNASMGRLAELLDTPPEHSRPDGQVTDSPLFGGVEFRHLTFSYPGQPPVLEDISFRLEPGKTLAIVGPTGSGKSTLVNLIPRLYDPPPGTVFVDGVDALDMPLDRLRQTVSAVPQDTLLFSTTIKENIRYGRPDASMEQVLEVAETAQISRDIESFPDQYETMVGERGVTLSGGQKQRATIARAVLTDPRILILDDALSSVDTCTEEEILKRLRGVMARRTTLIVSHRISTIREADRILVLERGRIVEQGTHETLVAAGGMYSRIYEKQLLQDALTRME